jgi:hypothetical protein
VFRKTERSGSRNNSVSCAIKEDQYFPSQMNPATTLKLALLRGCNLFLHLFAAALCQNALAPEHEDNGAARGYAVASCACLVAECLSIMSGATLLKPSLSLFSIVFHSGGWFWTIWAILDNPSSAVQRLFFTFVMPPFLVELGFQAPRLYGSLNTLFATLVVFANSVWAVVKRCQRRRNQPGEGESNGMSRPVLSTILATGDKGSGGSENSYSRLLARKEQRNDGSTNKTQPISSAVRGMKPPAFTPPKQERRMAQRKRRETKGDQGKEADNNNGDDDDDDDDDDNRGNAKEEKSESKEVKRSKEPVILRQELEETD